MNHDKSYFKMYDNNEYTNNFDFIIEKSNNNSYQIETHNNSINVNVNVNVNMIILQNKVEELFLKLKFLNSNKKISTINVSNYVNDINNINININNDLIINNKIIDINYINENTNSNNIIDLIDKMILKLDKKIICKGQIKRKNNLIDFEF